MLFRLYRNRQGLTKSKVTKGKAKKGKVKRKNGPPTPTIAPVPSWRELITLLAGWFPDRQFVVSGDAPRRQSVLQHMPSNVDLLSRVVPTGVLYAPAPPPSPTARAADTKKRRLGGMAEWAADASQPWQELIFDQFGLHATLQVKTMQALYYGAGRNRLLTVVLVRRAGQAS